MQHNCVQDSSRPTRRSSGTPQKRGAPQLYVRDMPKLKCPHCDKPLGWKLLRGKPLPGERKVLPNKAVLVCPFCKGELYNNPHPAEHWIFLAFLPMFFAFQFQLENPWMLLLSLFIGAGATIYVHFKYLRNWPRFSSKPMPIKFPFNWKH